MVLMEERSKTSYGDSYSYIFGSYYEETQHQEQTVVNNIINRNDITVVVDNPAPYYHYHNNNRRFHVPRQHWLARNQLTRP